MGAEAALRALCTADLTAALIATGPQTRTLELRAAARGGKAPVGISPDGKIWEVDGVWHPRSVIENSLVSASETAMSMLRIDQVISARGD